VAASGLSNLNSIARGIAALDPVSFGVCRHLTRTKPYLAGGTFLAILFRILSNHALFKLPYLNTMGIISLYNELTPFITDNTLNIVSLSSF
jgi:hypothetical protein